MDTFSPEFSAYWLGEAGNAGERLGVDCVSTREALSPSQQVALEELAERVYAARSVV